MNRDFFRRAGAVVALTVAMTGILLFWMMVYCDYYNDANISIPPNAPDTFVIDAPRGIYSPWGLSFFGRYTGTQLGTVAFEGFAVFCLGLVAYRWLLGRPLWNSIGYTWFWSAMPVLLVFQVGLLFRKPHWLFGHATVFSRNWTLFGFPILSNFILLVLAAVSLGYAVIRYARGKPL